MQLEEVQNLIALYALDLLDESERCIVEEAIASNPQLQTELANFQLAASAIAYSAPPTSIAANLKARLFERIAPQKREPDLTYVNTLRQQAVNVNWQPYAPLPGLEVGTLYVDREKQEVAYFVRAEAGLQFPTHYHVGNEEMILLEGDLIVDRKTYTEGAVICSEPNSSHQPSTVNGCLLFLRSSLEDAIVD
ncbi:MAG: cupin domain-containing protein [Hydrococcus sp. Prado102]|jgi:quercetin dioxygenase-like cupin family protein|nr:cupin domain-containing protein [Hydrococcus sp. Prado102]